MKILKIKNAITTYQPDIIVVNSGGAVWGEDVILMDEKKVIELAQFAPDAKVVAVHMESLDHCKTTRQMVKDAAQKANLTIMVPDDGETILL